MTEYIEVFSVASTTDGFGSETTTYTSQGTIHAEVSWKSGSTDREASELFSGERLDFIIRDAHAVAPKWRVSYAGTLYNVTAVEHNRVRGYKRLVCEKVND